MDIRHAGTYISGLSSSLKRRIFDLRKPFLLLMNTDITRVVLAVGSLSFLASMALYCIVSTNPQYFPVFFATLSTGGYCEEYMNCKRPVGTMIEDTWLLKFVNNSKVCITPLSSSLHRITLPSDTPPQTPTTPSSKTNDPVVSSSNSNSSFKGASSSNSGGLTFK